MKIKLYFSKHHDTTYLTSVIRDLIEKNNYKEVDSDPDICISIGGDGTFLRMIEDNNYDETIKYIGINHGTLGFLTQIKPEEVEKLFISLKEESYKIKQLSYENIKVIANDREYYYKALNELSIRDNTLKTAYFDILINNELLENYVGDGVIISTQVGSTAYSLSTGGAIIYDGIDVMEITPTSPINNYIYHTLSSSVIVPGSNEIQIIPKNRTSNLSLSLDGKLVSIKKVEKVVVTLSTKKINIIRLDDINYTNTIYEKFLK